MQKISLIYNHQKLKELYENELKEYILVNRQATFKMLLFSIPALLISIIPLFFDDTQRYIVPWYVISGITGLYLIVRSIIYQVDSFYASNRTDTEVELYLKKIQPLDSRYYLVSGEAIECYIDDKLEYITKWDELNALIEKESYFCLFYDNGKVIFALKYAVQSELYKEFLNQAKKNIRKSNEKVTS